MFGAVAYAFFLLPATVDRGVERLQSELHEQSVSFRAELHTQGLQLQANVNQQLTQTRTGVLQLATVRSGEALQLVNQHATRYGDSLALAAESVDVAASGLGAAGRALAHSAEEADKATEAVNLTVRDLRPQLVGLAAASKIAAGQVAVTARAVQTATPEVLASVKQTADASARASENAADTFDNLKRQSKPLPMVFRFLPQAAQVVLLGLGVFK